MSRWNKVINTKGKQAFLPMGMSLCLCLEDMTSWPDDQEEWVLLVLVGEVLEIMAMSLEELQEEVMLGLEWDCEWW